MKSLLIYFRAQLTLIVALLTVFAFGDCVRLTSSGLHISVSSNREGANQGSALNVFPQEGMKEDIATELYPTGSSLPDCAHACGPCSPCKRVMVGFKCPMAESCPVVYRCMCRGRYYQVPSN